MDDTDRKLVDLVCTNPRMHFGELAEILGISKQAVHHRLGVLTQAGILKTPMAGISVASLDAIAVAVFGRHRTKFAEEAFDRLARNDITRRVLVAGGNYVYVVGFLRRLSELDGFVEFVKREVGMLEPTVGIYADDDGLMPYPVDGTGAAKRKENYRNLSPLDAKIVHALKDDARTPAAEIAKKVKVTPKTVKRHLDDMMRDGLLDLSAPADMILGGDLFLVMHVNLMDDVDKRVVGRRLLSKHYFENQYIRSFSNLPGLLVWVFWSDKMIEIRRALEETSEDEDVSSTMLNFVCLERIYPTWRANLAESSARTHKKEKTHKERSASRTRRP